VCGLVAVTAFCAALVFAQDAPQSVQLPKPQMEGGRPLMEVLKDRKSSRAFSPTPLSDQQLSNLLWAADGINRPESGKRTAPSAVNWQEVDVYVAMANGLYLFEPKAHALKLVVKDDIRALTGMQPFVKDAPVNLIYVADLAKTGKGSEADKSLFVAADTGFISQNVYLYCASEGLATVVRGMVDRETLAKAMQLRPEQRIMLAQSVGLPRQ
jgi:SagB-type dehydrogenase family enzyme